MKRIAWLLMFLLFVPSFVAIAEDQPSISDFQLKRFSDNILVLTFSFQDVKGGIGKASTEMALMAVEGGTIIYQDTHEGALDVRFSVGTKDESESGIFMGIFPVPAPVLQKKISVIEVGLMLTDDQGRKSKKVFSNKVVVINKGYKM